MPRRAKAEDEGAGLDVVQPPSVSADENSFALKLDAILDGLHALRQLVHRMTVPVTVVNVTEAAKRLGRSTRTIKTLCAKRIFTDGRAPESRLKGSSLMFYADEIEVYRSEGERGVKRLREELGRL